MPNPPPSLVSQTATRSCPGSTQLDEIVLWDYAFTIAGESDITFEVTWNEEQTVAYTMQQAKVVNVDGPLRTIVFERLDLREVQCARASAQGVAFPASIAPSVEVVSPVTIDAATDSVSANLAAFFATLTSGSTWPIEIRCFYSYTLNGLSIAVPVVLVPRQDVTIDDATLFEQIEASIQQWLHAAQPPTSDARLSLAITIWSTIPGVDAPLLQIADASLAMTAVAPPS
jgi:hypothetical protein